MARRYRYDDSHDTYDDHDPADDECGADVMERRKEARREREEEERIERKAQRNRWRTFREEMPSVPFFVEECRFDEASEGFDGGVLLRANDGWCACTLDTEWVPA